MADDTPSLDPATLLRRLADGERVTLLDVRDRDEIDRWRIDAPTLDAHHVPYVKFVAAGVSGDPASLLPPEAVEPVVVVCPRGEASAEVAGQLLDAGVDAYNLAGGMVGWARLLDSHRLDVDIDAGDATVTQYHRPATGCVGYAVADGDETLVVDPLRAFADGYGAVEYAVDTHLHADHVSGVRALAADGATGVLPAATVDRGIADADAFETVAPGDELVVGDTTVEAVALPGHTTGMTGFRVGDALLTGDSLFLDGVARPDLQEGADPRAQARDLYATLTERLAAFDDGMLIAPGHADPATAVGTAGPLTARLGDLRECLWALGVDEATFVERAVAAGADPANAERVVAVNAGRETVDAETAFDLELGPNNCAAG
jgi:glyoxylase-like metal-dependent hydrolase (beta-lactamase superfamily II)/rhodanese-related sulfurtransferase